ncbi:MAG: D-glycero-alpha-D-manno-heptose-1,7-bisphosphate 7-phosphatase [Pseudomonadota bacterium]
MLAATLSGVSRRALFLDRDGVVNVDHGYVHSTDQTEWVPGIFDLARAAHDAGWAVIVVTNQAGIGRGYYSLDQFVTYTEWVHDVFRQRGARVLATYYCPHHPSEGLDVYRKACGARKPGAGMIRRAIADWNIDARRSILIGDKPTDVEAASVGGIGTALLIPSNDLVGSLEALRSLL